MHLRSCKLFLPGFVLVGTGSLITACAPTQVHPSVQASAIGAAGCGVVGAAASNRRTAARSAVACGIIGAIFGAHLESVREGHARSARSAEDQILLIRRRTEEVYAENMRLRLEVDRLVQLAAYYRTELNQNSTNLVAVRNEILTRQTHARHQLEEVRELSRRTSEMMRELDRRSPTYRHEAESLRSYYESLRQSARTLNDMISVRI